MIILVLDDVGVFRFIIFYFYICANSVRDLGFCMVCFQVDFVDEIKSIERCMRKFKNWRESMDRNGMQGFRRGTRRNI